MAKKKKGSRPSASGKARKRTAARPRKQAAKARAAVHRGLAKPGKVDLKFLKKDIDDHIERLKGMDQADTRVGEAMAALEGARVALKSPCAPTMVIP